MNITPLGGSARIYEFPRGGRAGLAARNGAERYDADLAALRAAPVSVGSSWYHEEAIRSEDKKNTHS